MYIPKKYGEGKIDSCPFCNRQAFSKNAEGIPVCNGHKNESLGEVKCMCGTSLQMMHGKFGVFFNCLKCGNMNLRKAMEINSFRESGNSNSGRNKDSDGKDNEEEHFSIEKPYQKKEIVVRSDDPRYFD